MRGRKKERGGGAVEAVVGVCLVLGAFAVMIVIYLSAVERANVGILRARLRALRNQEKVFRVLEGRRPGDLRELVNSRWSLFPLGTADIAVEPVSQALKEEAVLPVAADKEGFPLDPWGNPFAYAPSTGNIHSVTPGKESW